MASAGQITVRATVEHTQFQRGATSLNTSLKSIQSIATGVGKSTKGLLSLTSFTGGGGIAGIVGGIVKVIAQFKILKASADAATVSMTKAGAAAKMSAAGGKGAAGGFMAGAGRYGPHALVATMGIGLISEEIQGFRNSDKSMKELTERMEARYKPKGFSETWSTATTEQGKKLQQQYLQTQGFLAEDKQAYKDLRNIPWHEKMLRKMNQNEYQLSKNLLNQEMDSNAKHLESLKKRIKIEEELYQTQQKQKQEQKEQAELAKQQAAQAKKKAQEEKEAAKEAMKIKLEQMASFSERPELVTRRFDFRMPQQQNKAAEQVSLLKQQYDELRKQTSALTKIASGQSMGESLPL